MIANTDALVNTFKFEGSAPRIFPPSQLLYGYAPELASIVDEYERAVSERDKAVTAFRSMSPGGRAFAGALAADRASVGDHVMQHGVLPSPAASPMVRWLTHDVAVAFVATHHAAWFAESVAAQVPTWIHAHGKPMVAAIDADMDSKRDAIAELLLTARDRKDKYAFIGAQREMPEWSQLNALRRWVTSNGAAYAPRNGGPAELVFLAFDAATATQTEPPGIVPEYTRVVAEYERTHPRYANKTYQPSKQQLRAIGA